MKTKERAMKMAGLDIKTGMFKTKGKFTFKPQDDKENVESLNAGYMAETAPYGTYVTNKK